MTELCVVHPGGLSPGCWSGLAAYLPLTVLALPRGDSVEDLAALLLRWIR